MLVISESVTEFKICSSIPSPFLPSFLLHFSLGLPDMALLPSWHTSLPYQLHPVLGGISIPNPCRGRCRDPQVQGLCLSSGFCALWDLLSPFPDFYCICHQVVGSETTTWHGEDTLDIWVTHVCRVCVWCQLSQWSMECKLECWKNDEKIPNVGQYLKRKIFQYVYVNNSNLNRVFNLKFLWFHFNFIVLVYLSV